jgi:hypothetical protein
VVDHALLDQEHAATEHHDQEHVESDPAQRVQGGDKLPRGQLMPTRAAAGTRASEIRAPRMTARRNAVTITRPATAPQAETTQSASWDG